MSTRSATIIVDAKLAEAYNAAAKTREKGAIRHASGIADQAGGKVESSASLPERDGVVS